MSSNIKTIQIFVKVPRKTIIISIENGYNMSVAELKQKIYDREGIPESVSFTDLPVNPGPLSSIIIQLTFFGFFESSFN